MNTVRLEISYRNGIGLCSARNPQREAERWLATQAKSIKNGPFLILGLGAGFHVAQMVQAYPNSSIYVFDYEVELRTRFLEQFCKICSCEIFIDKEIDSFLARFDLNKFEAILSFRPSWIGFESRFENLERDLLRKPWKEQRHSNQKVVSEGTAKIFEELLA